MERKELKENELTEVAGGRRVELNRNIVAKTHYHEFVELTKLILSFMRKIV
ncbi:MAG: hypothetical protein KBT48_08540 [Firmicutes bacterium]|nr:hypothetical protein [Bacillota bacterium]